MDAGTSTVIAIYGLEVCNFSDMDNQFHFHAKHEIQHLSLDVLWM